MIISPYFSQASESASHIDALPKLRVFHTVNHAGARIVPFELQINVIPQRKILHRLLLENVLAIFENPYKVDGINLNKESVQLKCKNSRVAIMTKGEKLCRSLRQLFEINRSKLTK